MNIEESIRFGKPLMESLDIVLRLNENYCRTRRFRNA